MRNFTLALAAAGAVAAAQAQAATGDRIGTTASAKNHVTGTIGEAKRALRVGDGIFRDENIATGPGASAQLLFADETALNMGPDSIVKLDKFVYDPSRRAGQVTLRAVTGSFRFVTGSGPKEGYKIDTPVGTIGVRGTIIEFAILGPRMTLSLTEGGAYVCTPAQKCVELNQPGTYVIVSATEVGDVKSSKAPACGANPVAGCTVNDDNLYIQFLGLGQFINTLAPGAGPTLPPPPPGNPPPGNPPPPPPPAAGFPPVQTGAGTIPPGLANRDTLPPGLVNNRGPNFEPPGHTKKGN